MATAILLVSLLCIHGTMGSEQQAESESTSNEPELVTTTGRIKGFQQTVNGKDVDTFLGIPFAMPPLNNLRFKRPVRVQPWTHTQTTQSLANSCPQTLLNTFPGNPGEAAWNSKTPLSEDCLYLNIWVPKDESVHPKTTMVWIFGGGFTSGTTALDVYDGKTLAAEENVIVASMNYRLGPLGFLYLGTEDAPGNVGLLDQVMAMEWIYNNIEAFGGSKQQITLFGESAGASSVHYQTLSNLGTQFFSKAIIQSGSALAHWAYQEPEVALSMATKLAASVQCNTNEPVTTATCLRQISAGKLISNQWTLDLDWIFTMFPFVPTLDGHFIHRSPLDIMRSGDYKKLPLLLGVNKNEASYFIIYGVNGDSEAATSGVIDKQKFMLYLTSTIDINFNELTRSAICNEYTAPFQPNKDYMQILDNIGGDYSFKCPTLRVANFTARDPDNVYVYSFEHRTVNNSWPEWTGVLHGDEIFYIFGRPLENGTEYTDEEQMLSIRMMKYWANFAKTGNPNSLSSNEASTAWPVYNLMDEKYVRITGEGDSVGGGLRHKQCEFWSNFFPKVQQASVTANGCNGHGIFLNGNLGYQLDNGGF